MPAGREVRAVVHPLGTMRPKGRTRGLDAAPEVVAPEAVGRRLVPVCRATAARAVEAHDQGRTLHFVRCAGGEGAVDLATRTHEGGVRLLALVIVSGHLREKGGTVNTHEPPP